MVNTYLIKSGKYYKIGRANKVYIRLSQIQIGNPIKVKLVYYHKFDIEHTAHKMFESKRIRGEWFELSDDDVKKFMSFSIDDVTSARDEKNRLEEQEVLTELMFATYCFYDEYDVYPTKRLLMDYCDKVSKYQINKHAKLDEHYVSRSDYIAQVVSKHKDLNKETGKEDAAREADVTINTINKYWNKDNEENII